MRKIVAMLGLSIAVTGAAAWAETPAASAPAAATAASSVPVTKSANADEQKAIDAIIKLGGTVEADGEGKPVTIVTLRDTEADDKVLELIKVFTALRNLDLANTKVTDAGLDHIKGLTALTHLEVGFCNITDAGLVKVQGIKTLQLLGISRTHVTDKVVKDVQAALPKCQIDWIFDNPDEPKEEKMK